jgi:membrane fusion protein, multidrug efflux system
MNHGFNRVESPPILAQSSRPVGSRALTGPLALIGLVAVSALAYHLYGSRTTSTPAPPPPTVTVSEPIQRNLEARLAFLGQFSAVESVELRAQVGGTLTEIHFKDGEIVKKGQLLFVIDPVPYEIKLAQATAQLESANARLNLANRELARAQMLKNTDAGSTENVEQRTADQQAAQAAVDNAHALVRDARFDLDHCRITAPFTGRIGNHLVSTGNLVAGSRAAASPTTLLTTLLSLDPIWLNFDMSESAYMTFQRQRAKTSESRADRVDVALSDETKFDREGTLDFIDNALDRSSGTIHARAAVKNNDALLTPGGFARVRLAISTPAPTLLVPDDAVLSDQSDHAVLLLGKDNIVVQKKVEVGALRGGLRVIRSGLSLTDKVIIEGIPAARPGAPVSPQPGSIRFESDQN